MEFINTLIHNPTLASLVNMQVFGAILLALVVYRIVAPLIDFINPVIILTDLGWLLRRACVSAGWNAFKKMSKHDEKRSHVSV